MSSTPSKPVRAPAKFVTTRWSIVLATGNAENADARRALDTLCQQYWYPVYAHIRRRGQSDADAEDSTQEFFAGLIERDGLQGADPVRGRFRSYLLGAVDHFLANQHSRNQTQKRGGNRKFLSIDRRDAENRLLVEPDDLVTPERGFERSWAISLLDQIGDQLRREYAKSGRAELFEALRPHLPRNSASRSHAELADELRMSTAAVKVAIHRLRQRFGRLLREEILQTVEHPEEVDDEIRWLHTALSNNSS